MAFPANVDNRQFYVTVASPAEATWGTSYTVAASTLSATVWTEAIATGAGATQSGLAGSGTRAIEFVHTANIAIAVSFNATGGTTTGTVQRRYPAGAYTIDLRALGLENTANVCIRGDGAAPASGTVYINFIK